MILLLKYIQPLNRAFKIAILSIKEKMFLLIFLSIFAIESISLSKPLKVPHLFFEKNNIIIKDNYAYSILKFYGFEFLISENIFNSSSCRKIKKENICLKKISQLANLIEMSFESLQNEIGHDNFLMIKNNKHEIKILFDNIYEKSNFYRGYYYPEKLDENIIVVDGEFLTSQNTLQTSLVLGYSTLIHELSHLLFFKIKGPTEMWFNEGIADLLTYIITKNIEPQISDYTEGFFNETSVLNFLESPSRSLIEFDPKNYVDHGKVFLFFLYLYDHFGKEQFLRSIFSTTANDSIKSINKALINIGSTQYPLHVKNFNSIFVHFVYALAENSRYNTTSLFSFLHVLCNHSFIEKIKADKKNLPQGFLNPFQFSLIPLSTKTTGFCSENSIHFKMTSDQELLFYLIKPSLDPDKTERIYLNSSIHKFNCSELPIDSYLMVINSTHLKSNYKIDFFLDSSISTK